MEVSNKIDQKTNEYSGNDYFKESISYYNSDPFIHELLSNNSDQLGIYFFLKN